MKETPSTPPQSSDISSFQFSTQDNAHFAHDEQFNPVKAEMALWSAVITQALMDAGSESRKPEAIQEKTRATRWLLGNSDDFVTVCLNAGYEPAYIRTKALAAIARGCTWRKDISTKRARLPQAEYEQKSLSPTLSYTPAIVQGVTFLPLHHAAPRYSRAVVNQAPR